MKLSELNRPVTVGLTVGEGHRVTAALQAAKAQRDGGAADALAVGTAILTMQLIDGGQHVAVNRALAFEAVLRWTDDEAGDILRAAWMDRPENADARAEVEAWEAERAAEDGGRS